MQEPSDNDAILLIVDQIGVACHTGHRSCFYTAIRDDAAVEISAPLVSEQELYGQPASAAT